MVVDEVGLIICERIVLGYEEDEKEDGKQRVERRRESSNTQHERMDGMKESARHTLFLSQCQCDIKSVVNQREHVTCEVCYSQGM